MEKLKLEVIKKVLMLDTLAEVKSMRENVSDAISRECALEDKEQEQFKKWKADQVNV